MKNINRGQTWQLFLYLFDFSIFTEWKLIYLMYCVMTKQLLSNEMKIHCRSLLHYLLFEIASTDVLKTYYKIEYASDCMHLKSSLELIHKWCLLNTLYLNVQERSVWLKSKDIAFNCNSNDLAVKRVVQGPRRYLR